MGQGGVGPNSGISGILIIDRFGHQSGRGERSGGLNTDTFYVFLARVFLDMSQEALINNTIGFPGQNWLGGRGRLSSI